VLLVRHSRRQAQFFLLLLLGSVAPDAKKEEEEETGEEERLEVEWDKDFVTTFRRPPHQHFNPLSGD